ncbi:hypothetical protein RO3G_11669 [Rhizopus delemar RA 99-880]|uniref:Uncharacterized protein n=1 Tax=Rhizopus delemar (strain RA 99-880 / ATCC MYA-4621 / FGSC 9543 / NRRL 43880) TaxID=246409 RepID=I1CES8_RHIO9|nr:hypothetical protein RO3G_11669 [Rhizopus delemar RA 99-880]|eukprot:EIE86958.1 hypothetical protein RO3G_11669 [Rhizopus delemar RA 99-880]
MYLDTYDISKCSLPISDLGLAMVARHNNAIVFICKSYKVNYLSLPKLILENLSSYQCPKPPVVELRVL